MPNNFEKKRIMKGLNATQEIFFKIVDLSLVDIFVKNLDEKPIIHKYASFFKHWLYIFSVILNNENKQRPASLFYHVLLIKQNECVTKTWSIGYPNLVVVFARHLLIKDYSNEYTRNQVENHKQTALILLYPEAHQDLGKDLSATGRCSL